MNNGKTLFAQIMDFLPSMQQLNKFDLFVDHYNQERPHQALNMKYPAEVYTPSTSVYRIPDEPEYPFHDKSIRVTTCGRICFNNRKINLSTVMAGQIVGIREVCDKIWLVSFVQYDIGYFDENEIRVELIDNPFGPNLLPMSPVRTFFIW